jgi:hypothetical protein
LADNLFKLRLALSHFMICFSRSVARFIESMNMEKEKLIRKLNSVGKEAFVNHYYLFKDYANHKITKDVAIQKLMDEGRSNADGASIRLGNAKVIFGEQGDCEALRVIQKSKRLSEEIIESAKAIYKENCQ